MPILYRDPWRAQFFENTACSDDVVIPVKDYDAYISFPRYRWAYNKLLIAEKQDLLCAPHGVTPPAFPVFSKPIYNLNTMGADSRMLNSMQDYIENRTAGHMWSEVLEGDHLSTDVAVLSGTVVWASHTRGYPLIQGTFDRWDINVSVDEDVMQYLADFVRVHFDGYTGMMNLETLGGRLIEMHLRFADQWPDLYPRGFMDSVVSLYSGNWNPSKEMTDNQSTAYSVVLFGPPGRYCWTKPAEDKVRELSLSYQLLSIQMPFYDAQPTSQHSMPPGGFRLAILNGYDLESCLRAREELAGLFRNANGLQAEGRRSSMARSSRVAVVSSI